MWVPDGDITDQLQDEYALKTVLMVFYTALLVGTGGVFLFWTKKPCKILIV